MGRTVLGLVGGLIVLLGGMHTTAAQTVQACPVASNCAHIGIGSATEAPGQNARVALTFTQGPTDGQPGGIDEIATLALTLDMAGAGTPLTLADCTLNARGVPHAVQLAPAISMFTVVVQNVTCSGAQPHCLCPDPGSGITPDPFIDLVVFGSPAATPGSGGSQIPTLPSGQLLTIDLRIAPGASGNVPLHVLTPWSDNARPPFTAFVSAGDRLGIDQTCVPAAGVPPCGGAAPVSQLTVADGAITILIPTATNSPTAVLTRTPAPTLPSTVTATPASTPTPTLTITATATLASTPTGTRSSTATPTPVSTDTPPGSPTATAPPTATQTVPPEASPTASAQNTATLTATPILTPAPTTGSTCAGDCNTDGQVTIDEILTMVDIALRQALPTDCMPGDTNGDHLISIEEILKAINNALGQC